MTPAAVLSILVKQQGVGETSAQLETLDKNARRASASADKSGKLIGLAFKTMAVGAVGVGAGLVGAVKASADFEKQMSSLKAVTDSSAATMAEFKKQAIDAGIKTAFSAKQAAKAQTELAKGGLSVKNIMDGGLNASLALAAAGNVDLADAASTTANALNLFGLRGKDAMKVADGLATAANATTADVADFSMALAAGGSVAKSAGLSFADTTVALEALASAGIKNSDAGTSLKSALIALLKPSKQQAEATKQLGLHFIDAKGNMKGLSDISAMLRDKLGGMTKAQRTATLATIAGTDGVRTLTSLYDAGPKKLDEFRKGLEKQGSAARVAATMQDNLAGKFEQFKGTIETIAIVVGDKLRPTVQRVVIALTDFANGLLTGEGAGGKFRDTVVNAFTAVKTTVMGAVANVREFVAEFQDGQGKAVALGAALGGLAAGAVAIQAISTATKAWAAAQLALDAAMAANPVGLIIAGLVALGTALVIAYKKSETFRDIVNGTWASIKATVSAVVGWLTGAVNTVIDEVSQWKVLFATVAVAWKIVSAYWKADLAVIVAVVKAAFGTVKAVVKAAVDFLGPIVSAAWAGIKQTFKGVLDIIIGLVKVFGGLLKGDFGQMWEGVKQIFKGALVAMEGIMRGGIDTVLKIVRGIPGKILTALGDLTKTLEGAGGDLVGGLASGIRGALDEITKVAGWLKDQVVGAVRKAFGIHSPSTVMADLGGHMASGLIKGVLGGNIMGFIKNHLGGVDALAGNLVKKGLLSAADLPGKVLGKIGGFLGLGGGGTSGGNQEIGRKMMLAMGWGPDQWPALKALWTGESGWSEKAYNASSGATGIPQSLPGSKMASAGADWRTNPATQIKWGLGYIRSVYGSPANAYAQWLARSPHWYAKGTPSAAPGWAVVGENGPELMKMKGGETVLSNAKSLDAVKNQSKWLQSTWEQFASFLGQSATSSIASYFAKVRMDNRIPFAGVAWDGEARKGTPDLLWPRWIWSDTPGQKALDLAARRQLLIHEMAHRFQVAKQVNEEWKSEGGAEAFARRVMDQVFGGRVVAKGDPYNAYANKVEKTLGAAWVMGGQFGRAAAGYAKGTMGAMPGWAWVGEKGPELVNFKGGETVLSHGNSMSLSGYASGTVSPSVLAQIKKAQAKNAPLLSTTSAFTTMKGLTGLETALSDSLPDTLRAATALAALTPDLADDIAAAQSVVAYQQAAFARAQASGNAGAIADSATALKTAQDNLTALRDNTDALNNQNELLQQQLDLVKQQAQDAQNSYNVSQSQYATLAQAIADIANGQLGQRVGVGMSGFRAPAGALSRI